MQWRWYFSAVFTNCQHSSSDCAAGTSTATCLPCSMAYTAIGTCLSHGVAIYTRSMSSRSQSCFQPSSPLYDAASGKPRFERIPCALSTRSG